MNLKTTKKPNPMKREEEKYYLTPKYSGELGTKELAQALSKSCTLTVADITAVLEALTSQMPWYLKNGFIIQLGALGRMKLSVSSEGHFNEKDVSTNDISKVRVIFTPSAEMKKEVNDISFSIE